ncbi:MAG: S8 family peptidase [Ignavibacteria bacterium]|nr:S8 family peptidase [Ignavibacteria bacterium]
MDSKNTGMYGKKFSPMKYSIPKNIILAFACSITAFIILTGTGIEKKISSRLEQDLKFAPSETKHLVWIFFKDKGAVSELHSKPERFLTHKSIDRRNKRLKSFEITDDLDLPVNQEYIKMISDMGIEIRQKSKWFNGISCYATKVQIDIISGKSFVKEADIVRKYKKSIRDTDYINGESFSENKILGNPSNTSDINYGPSFNQSNLINIPAVHDLGYTGSGVLIASFDAGFDNLDHTCFDMIREKGIRSYDFVNGDTIVANDTGRKGNGSHGTLTLSLVCGFDPGWLVSPAFDSEIILAKTENTDSETPLEEDNWIAAAEWADSLGADIITSSLTYLDFNSPYPSYTWQDMDGNTARITLAADIAVSKGITVVISAGNDGFNPDHNTLGAPADGKKVITVGAVTLGKLRAGFSSVGPTVDGRIKPEVMALGISNYTAFPGAGNVGYLNSSSGTSLACPMVAGVCAIMLSANPLLTPEDVKQLLLSSSERTGQPDNLLGWGIVNALSAVNAAIRFNNAVPGDFTLDQNFPNPFNPSTTIKILLKKEATLSVIIHDITGRQSAVIISNKFYNAGNYSLKYNPELNGLQSGVYFYSLIANGLKIDTKKFIYLK